MNKPSDRFVLPRLLRSRRVRALPDPVTAAQSIDHHAEASAADAGLAGGAAEAIWAAVLGWYATGTQPFISLCLRRRGEVVLQRSVGHVSGNGPPDQEQAGAKPVVGGPASPVALFSASKMITAVLVHALAETGDLELDRPVAHYLPAFAARGKAGITVLDLLAHRGGLPQMPRGFPPEAVFDERETLARLCAERAVAPGRGQAYHAISAGFVLGGVVNAVTGEDVEAVLRERIRQPLGLTTFGYGLDASRRGELAQNYATGPDLVFPVNLLVRRALGADWDTVVELSNDPRFCSARIPAGNVIASAPDVATFMQMLLNEGRYGGQQILQKKTVQRAVRPLGMTSLDRTLLVPMRYSAGLMLGNSPVGLFGPVSRRAFGHLGFINIFCWADPDRDVAAALLSTGKSLLGTHLLELARLMSKIAMATRSRS